MAAHKSDWEVPVPERPSKIAAVAVAAAFACTSGALTAAAANTRTSAESSAAAPTAFGTRSAVSAYETTVAGDPATVYAPATGTALPVALLLQGANVGRTQYASYARAVASHGFVVVVPDHQRVIFGTPGLYPVQEQAARTVAWAQAENTAAASPVLGRVDTGSLVLIGHSFGGAASLYAVQGPCQVPFCVPPGEARPAELKAAVVYGTNTADPAGGGAAPIDTGGIPVAFIQGGRDGLASPSQAEATYDALATGPASLITVPDANHYGLTDVQNPAGSRPDPSAQPLPQAATIDIAARWTALYLRARLGDGWSAAYLYSGLADLVDANATVRHRS
ncbi:alpha/beta hydrolase family protein [Yinghuangia sp. YIM S09857]|uniref:alpha/beta hydrolase family protein n=1 Tax=Yinghuangia sp. YIM S09857 TaxID=3436929 RepID=UPI003F53B141